MTHCDRCSFAEVFRHNHQKTTEIYAGHIETGTKKQTDFLNDFWKGKLNETKGVASSAASNSGEKTRRIEP